MPRKTLDQMTVAGLKQRARDRGVQLGGATRKADIVDKLRRGGGKKNPRKKVGGSDFTVKVVHPSEGQNSVFQVYEDRIHDLMMLNPDKRTEPRALHFSPKNEHEFQQINEKIRRMLNYRIQIVEPEGYNVAEFEAEETGAKTILQELKPDVVHPYRIVFVPENYDVFRSITLSISQILTSDEGVSDESFDITSEVTESHLGEDGEKYKRFLIEQANKRNFQISQIKNLFQEYEMRKSADQYFQMEVFLKKLNDLRIRIHNSPPNML